MTNTAQPTIVPATQVMLDIETYGTAPGSVIKTIGAVKFAIVDGKPTILDRFYRRIDAQSCTAVGLVIDGPTIEWWLTQSEEARAEIIKPGEALFYAMRSFQRWLFESDAEIWGNGAAFDQVLMSCAAVAVDLPAWDHRRSLCYRTIKNANHDLPIDAYRVRTHHNALDDAESQALHLMAIWEREAKRVKALQVLEILRMELLNNEAICAGNKGEWWQVCMDQIDSVLD